LFDFIADRKPFVEHALKLFDQVEEGKVKLYAAARSVANMPYILLKYIKDPELRLV
jgi:hypothetical protein